MEAKMRRTFQFRGVICALILTMIATTFSANGQLSSRMIADLNPGTNGSFPSNFFVYKNSLVFSASTPATGRELWGVNGTNIYLIQDINSTVTDLGGGVFVG